MKIAIVVHGRFDAFDLARELLRRKHEVTVFTNYPRWAAGRFHIPRDRIRSFWFHGLLSRLADFFHRAVRLPYPEAPLHQLFGHWAAREVAKERWDVIHCWSGVSKEILSCGDTRPSLKLLMRASTHIREQAKILEEEEKRTHIPLDRPSPWMIAREESEYALADAIRVLSRFAYQSFLNQGIPREKLRLIPSGTPFKLFRPPPEVVEARCKRIQSGSPLRVLYVGSISMRKGMWDMAVILKRLREEKFKFRLIGPLAVEGKNLLPELRQGAELISKQPQHQLPECYAWGDLFLFPTIEDGFPQVLVQAQASALPILTTPHSSGPDLVQGGNTGWILPVRSPEAFVDRLKWCDTHREELAQMVRRIYHEYRSRDWSEAAADFESICTEALRKHGI